MHTKIITLIKKEFYKSLDKAVFILFFLFISLSSSAQCAMCRAALESEEGNVQAKAINDGIVYLMIIPYVLVAVVGFAIYKIKFSKKK